MVRLVSVIWLRRHHSEIRGPAFNPEEIYLEASRYRSGPAAKSRENFMVIVGVFRHTHILSKLPGVINRGSRGWNRGRPCARQVHTDLIPKGNTS